MTLAGLYSITQISRSLAIPIWAAPPNSQDEFYSIAYTADEISIVTKAERVPSEAKSERDWAVLKVKGELDFSLTGILSDIAGVLAASEIPIFAISTFNTDYILVRHTHLHSAQRALRTKGHTVI